MAISTFPGIRWARLARFLAFVLGTACISGQSPNSPKQSKRQPTIHFVNSLEGFQDGGCTLWLANDIKDFYSGAKSIFVSDYNNRGRINIDGRDTMLRLMNFSEEKDPIRVGAHSTYWYRAKDVGVVINFTVTGVCAPDSESCEVTQYDATVKLTNTSGSAALKAHGLCGV